MSAEISYEPLFQHLYHLLRVAEVTRDSGQQPARRAVLQSTDVLEHLVRAHGGQLTALFTGSGAHLQGQLLRGPAKVHDMAQAIGAELAALNIHELGLGAGLKPDDLLALIARLAAAPRDPIARGAPVAVTPRVTLTSRDVALPNQHVELDLDMPVEERIIKVCAGFMVAMELLHDGLRAGQWHATRLVKHHLQLLLDLIEEAPDKLLSLTTAVQRTDPASLAVKGALLSMMTMRHMSQDRVLLRDVGMAAALLDTGLIRACGLMEHASKRGLEFFPRPSEDALDRMPEATATMLALWGQLALSSLPRALFTYEAHALMRRASRGMPHSGQFAPTQEAIVIALVRRYMELTALDLGAGAKRSPEDAIALLWKESTTRLERSCLQLFLHTIGFSMRGTPVQLTSGARGVVLGNQGRERALPFPVVRMVYDAQGRPLAAPIDVDLSELRDEALRFGVIRGVVRGHDERLVQLHEQLTSQPPPPPLGQPSSTPMFGVPLLQRPANAPAPQLPEPRRRNLPANNLPPSLDDLASAPLIDGEESLERSQSVVLSENFRLTSPDMSRTDAVRVVSGADLMHLVGVDMPEDDDTHEVDLASLRRAATPDAYSDETSEADRSEWTSNTDQTGPSGRSQDSYHETSQRILIANIPAELMVPLVTGVFPIPQPPPGWSAQESAPQPPTQPFLQAITPRQPQPEQPIELPPEGEATRIIEIPVDPAPQRRPLTAARVPVPPLPPLSPPLPPPGVEPVPEGEATRIIVMPAGLEDSTDATNVLPTSIIANIQVHDRRDE